MSIIEGLNERQAEAVTATEGFVRIIAGAGSGKTKALTHRYAYLVKVAGIPPGNVLCVTFTNKAAGEMKRRVRSLVGEGYDTSLITTYHGFCVRVLREDIGRMFYPENFQILDISAQKKILEDIYNKLELKLDYASFEKILSLIDKKKSTCDYVDLLIKRGNDDTAPAFKNLDEQVIHLYLLKQKSMFGLDFNDLINFVFVLFNRYPEVCRKWQERLQYIQVDEFQDSSERELRLIDLLSEVNRNLFVVGDPDQNIYEWRGAKVGILVNFDKTHDNTQTIIMDRNYRSTSNILTAANNLIAQNNNRIKKNLYTEGEAGDEVIHFHAQNENEENKYITDTIRKLKSDGKYNYGDIALMYRSGFLSQFLEKSLMAEEIPYEILGGTPFLERMEIADAIAYLTVIAYDDDNALLRIINAPRRMFGKAKAALLKEAAQRDGISLYSALKKYINDPQIQRTRVIELVNLIEKLRKSYKSMPISEILQTVLIESGYEQYIREAGNMERFDNLSELKRITGEYEHNYGKTSINDIMPAEFLSLEAYLQQLMLMRVNGDENEELTDRVKLMTIHAAKGLEFPVCFVVGFTEGVMPSGRTVEERKQEGLEEERRLCFVALTRAKEQLYLTDSEGTGQNGHKKIPSRFLFEIGENNYRRIGIISKEVAEQAKLNKNIIESSKSKHEIGDRVGHVLFGEGEITGIDEERKSYNVKFDSTGAVKPISMDYDFDLWNRLMKEQEAEEAQTPEQTTAFQKPIMPVPQKPEPPKPEPQKPELPKPEPQKTKSKPQRDPDSENLWKRDDVPHEGWYCIDIIDLGEPVGTCQMCGHQIIRYVHKMKHDNYPRIIGAGCVCAGRMQGNVEAAQKRESEYKNWLSRRQTFINSTRQRSKNGNEYIKYNGKFITILPDKSNIGKYKAVCDNSFTPSCQSIEEALMLVFSSLDPYKL